MPLTGEPGVEHWDFGSANGIEDEVTSDIVVTATREKKAITAEPRLVLDLSGGGIDRPSVLNQVADWIARTFRQLMRD